MVWKVPRYTHELFTVDLGRDFGRRGRIFWIMIVHCICRSVWLEQNRWIFDSVKESIEDC